MKLIILIYLIFFIHCNSSKKSANTLAIALVGTKSENTTAKTEPKKPKSSVNCLNTSTYSTKQFWARDESNNYVKSTFEQKCQTSNYNIWLKQGQSLATGVTIDEYINELENKIHPALVSYIGEPLDINNNNRVDIVIARTDSTIGGYVRDDPNGDYTNSSQSNQADILYLNNDITKALFYSTTAHELQHLFRIRYMYDSTTKTITKDSPWINEGTAEYIADRVYGIQSYRFKYFKENPNLYFLNGTNRTSIFYQAQRPRNYALFYVFSTYVYENSGTTSQEKKDFVYKITSGLDRSGNKLSTERCGDTANKFFKFFKQANTYSNSILGTTSQDIFKNLYGGFLYQTSYLNLDGTTINKIYHNGSEISTTYFDKIVQKYPLPDHFKSQFNSSSLNNDNYINDSSSYRTNIKNNTNTSGYHYFFKGHYSSSNMGNTQILIQYTRNGNQYSLLYDYSMNKKSPILPNIVYKSTLKN